MGMHIMENICLRKNKLINLENIFGANPHINLNFCQHLKCLIFKETDKCLEMRAKIELIS